MSGMELGIERVWLIECWRCANDAVDTGSEGEVREGWGKAGWFRNDDGYQLCPDCSGLRP